MLNRAILMAALVAEPGTASEPRMVFLCVLSGSPLTATIPVTGNARPILSTSLPGDRPLSSFPGYFTKGKMIIIEGSIQTRNYEDKNGNKRTAVEVVADNVQFGESKNASQGSGSSYSSAPSNNFSRPAAPAEPASYSSGSFGDFSEIDGEDDLPF